MDTRVYLEEDETIRLSPYAQLSLDSKGRRQTEEKCKFRTEYQRDRDRILHSKAFRRLKHKTQVFISPEGDHFRTRLTHTLEVSQIARTIGRSLALNEDLIEAIALGHDLGHTPFGHTGERILNDLHPKGFQHRYQSVRIVELLEKSKKRPGLNLTYEVREGILNHSGPNKSESLEGQVVRYADRIAYINHDIDDALRAGIIEAKDIPADCVRVLGASKSERINNMVEDIIVNSQNRPAINMSPGFEEYTNKLRDYMFKNVYEDSQAKAQEDKAEYIIKELYNYYKEVGLSDEYMETYKGIDGVTRDDMICDYIAGMTDRYVINKFKKIFVPQSWNDF